MKTSVVAHQPRSIGFGFVLLPLLALSAIGVILALRVAPAPVPEAAPVLVPAASPFFVVTFQYGTSTHMRQTIVAEAGGSMVRDLPQRDKVVVLIPGESAAQQQELLKSLTTNPRVQSVEPFSETP